ncbi:DNA translocase FtsK [Virgibacillus ainsalahensis]
MWGKFNKKIKNFLFKYEEEWHEETYTHRNQSPEAKMIYKYPEKAPFRFPVIPDEEKAKDRPGKENIQKNEQRNEQRNQQRNEQIKQLNHQQNHQQRKPEKSRNKIEKPVQERKVYKKNTDIPFQPTEVPSPIYGYQKHKEDKETDNVPAYKRKQEKEDELALLIKENQRYEMDNVEVEEAEEAEEKIEPVEVEDNSAVLYEVEHSEVAATEEKVQEQQLEMPSKPEQHEKRTTTKKQPDSLQQSKSNHSKNEKQIPYNVIMTPRDKKNRLEKEKARKAAQNHVQTLNPAQSQVKTQSKHEFIPYYLLDDPVEKSNDDRIWVQQQQELLEQTLKHFNVRAKVVNATQGPSVTRFEVQPELGVKVSKVKNLSDDLKLNMSAKDIRIEAPIPGKNTIGIEIPNQKAEMVGLQGIFETDDFKQSKSPLTIALGLSIEGTPLITNIQKMPHGLIAGATGSGKSVCINTILVSLLYKANHEDVKFLLIDPKMVELAPYNGIPNLVSPVITDVKAATAALKWAVNEMEERYEKFVQEGVRDIERYNQKIMNQNRSQEKMPFIVIVIDELADLMMVSPQDVEDSISRIAQKARACGIHLLVATQRPSVDVITGLIKANIPTRIAFSVSSQVDSRTIIDSSGAEKLLGKGDMLFVENGAGKSIRLQGPFVSDEEIERVTNYARTIASPNYLFEQEQLLEQATADEEEDVLLEEAVRFVLNQNSASTSLLQRHFKIGYNRAARLIDSLESRGIISGQNGSKPREVLVTKSQLEEM